MNKIAINKAGLAILSTVLLLLAAEYVIRKYFPTVPEGGHHKIFAEYHPVLGWIKKSNCIGKHVTSEYSVTETMNSRGIRGPEYSYEKKTNEYRILALGDSFTEGYTVQFEELFSEVVKKQLTDRNCEVINAGTGGYSTDQELLFFREEGRKYSPDLTVLLFCHNDVLSNNETEYWRGFKPVFRLKDHKLVAENIPVPPPEITTLDRMSSWIYEKSYVWRFIKDRTASSRKKLLANVPEKRKSKAPKALLVLKKQSITEIEEAWSITGLLINKLAEETAGAGSKLLVVYVPMREAIYPGDWEKTAKTYGITKEDWIVDLPRDRLQAICNTGNIAFLDLTIPFREKAITDPDLYFEIDRHWTKKGHALAGQVIANQILRMK